MVPATKYLDTIMPEDVQIDYLQLIYEICAGFIKGSYLVLGIIYNIYLTIYGYLYKNRLQFSGVAFNDKKGLKSIDQTL